MNKREQFKKFHLTDSFSSEKTSSCQQCLWHNHQCVLDSFNWDHSQKSENKSNSILSSISMHLNLSSNSLHTDHYSFLSLYSTSHLSVQSAITTINIDNDDSVSIVNISQNSSDAWQCLTNVKKHDRKKTNFKKSENYYLIKYVSVNVVEKLYSK